MAEEAEQAGIPEFRTWSFENLGQVLKISGHIEPEVFPYRVTVSKNSAFFRNAYNGVYKGKGVTVYGSEKGRHPIARGVIVEHMAILAANDLGEIMVSREIFQGDLSKSLTEYSRGKMGDYNRFTDSVLLPPGWRRFGILHSHPVFDVANSVILSFAKLPKADRVGVTWSGGDFKGLVEPINEGHTRETVEGVITPVQLGFMVATSKTLEVLKGKGDETTDLLKTTALGLPPYNNFEKLGIVLYAGNHQGPGNKFTLQRLIY